MSGREDRPQLGRLLRQRFDLFVGEFATGSDGMDTSQCFDDIVSDPVPHDGIVMERAVATTLKPGMATASRRRLVDRPLATQVGEHLQAVDYDRGFHRWQRSR